MGIFFHPSATRAAPYLTNNREAEKVQQLRCLSSALPASLVPFPLHTHSGPHLFGQSEIFFALLSTYL